jgi:hypothetical protein
VSRGEQLTRCLSRRETDGLAGGGDCAPLRFRSLVLILGVPNHAPCGVGLDVRPLPSRPRRRGGPSAAPQHPIGIRTQTDESFSKRGTHQLHGQGTLPTSASLRADAPSAATAASVQKLREFYFECYTSSCANFLPFQIFRGVLGFDLKRFRVV